MGKLPEDQSAWSVFLIFLKLGLTSFGGPVAHLGYFREEFVHQRRWLTETAYADLVSLCQFLPGPASSQVGIAIGLQRAGYPGAITAWLGFTLPSAVLMILFALGVGVYENQLPEGMIHGFKIVAVAVVAQAVWGMARSLCPDVTRATMMVAATCMVLLAQSVWAQVGVIVLAGIAGLMLFSDERDAESASADLRLSRCWGRFWLLLFVCLLFGLLLLAQLFPNQMLVLIDAFYRAGSLVFGGGHVVLPLLEAEVVPSGWVDKETFLAGYGAAQAVPGPLFTFAAFLGASMNLEPTGWVGGIICLVAIYVPSFLLVAGALPFWDQLRQNEYTRSALTGINAAVVGLLLAALYDPVWTSAIVEPEDFGLALLAFVALVFWKVSPWLVVLGCTLLSMSLAVL